jgi:hypothetical protein
MFLMFLRLESGQQIQAAIVCYAVNDLDSWDKEGSFLMNHDLNFVCSKTKCLSRSLTTVFFSQLACPLPERIGNCRLFVEF